MGKTQTYCQGAWRIKTDGEARHHPTKHINGQGDPGSADRAPMDIIDENQIHRRVINLDHSQRPVGAGKSALKRRILVPYGFAALAAAQLFLVTQGFNAVAHGVGVRPRDPRIAAAACYLMIRLLRRAFLAVEIKLFNGGGENRLHSGIKAVISRTHAAFGRSQAGELATVPILLQPAVERGGMPSRRLGLCLHLLPGTVRIIQ